MNSLLSKLKPSAPLKRHCQKNESEISSYSQNVFAVHTGLMYRKQFQSTLVVNISIKYSN